jgi:hypothetical protein
VRMAPIARPDAGTLLGRALVADAVRHGIGAAVRGWATHPWASATFLGACHRGVLAVDGEGIDAWLAALPERELAVRGHLVADLTARRAPDGLVAVEALTLVYA